MPSSVRSTSAVGASLWLSASTSLVFGAPASLAQAQPAVWAVVPVSVAEPPSASVSVAEHAGATLETSGATVLQGPTLAHRVGNSVSMPFVPAEAGNLAARLRQEQDPLLVMAASGETTRVIQRAEPLLRDAEPALLTLHRDAQASTDLANICGYWVRAALEQPGGETAARDVVTSCFRWIPGWEPSEDRHPPEVRQLVLSVREQLAGTLVIRSSDDDPPGCRVRVNGRVVGETPLARVRVPAGAYAIQLECIDAPGRVGSVEVESGAMEAVLRGSLDAALRNDPIALVYATPSALRALPADIAHLGRAVGATRVLAAVEEAQRVVLRAFEVPDGDAPGIQLRETTLSIPIDEASIRREVEQVASEAPPDDRGGSISPLGPILLGTGGAAIVAGIILGAIALGQSGDLVAQCPTQMNCPITLEPDVDRTHALAAGADALWIGGLVVAAIGLVLALVLRTGDRDREAHASALAWLGEPGAGGLRVTGVLP